jgi:hypothetical protein
MKREPVEETNEMEYYQKLVNLYASEYVLLLSFSWLFADDVSGNAFVTYVE